MLALHWDYENGRFMLQKVTLTADGYHKTSKRRNERRSTQRKAIHLRMSPFNERVCVARQR